MSPCVATLLYKHPVQCPGNFTHRHDSGGGVGWMNFKDEDCGVLLNVSACIVYVQEQMTFQVCVVTT